MSNLNPANETPEEVQRAIDAMNVLPAVPKGEGVLEHMREVALEDVTSPREIPVVEFATPSPAPAKVLDAEVRDAIYGVTQRGYQPWSAIGEADDAAEDSIPSAPRVYPLPVHLEVEQIDLTIDALESRLEDLVAAYLAHKEAAKVRLLADAETEKAMPYGRRVNTLEGTLHGPLRIQIDMLLYEILPALRAATPNVNIRVGKVFKVRDGYNKKIDRMLVESENAYGNFVCIFARNKNRKVTCDRFGRGQEAFMPEIIEDLGYDVMLDDPAPLLPVEEALV